MTAWTHPICVRCWADRTAQGAYRRPLSPTASCCWCGGDTDSGIFVRATPPANCGGHD